MIESYFNSVALRTLLSARNWQQETICSRVLVFFSFLVFFFLFILEYTF